MQPRPTPGRPISENNVSMRTKYNRQGEYDLPQLDLQWDWILKNQSYAKRLESGPRKIAQNYEVEPRFMTENELERGNSIARNYRQRASAKEEQLPLNADLEESAPLDEIDSVNKFGATRSSLQNNEATSDSIDGKGTINVKQLKQRLMEMDRKQLGGLSFHS